MTERFLAPLPFFIALIEMLKLYRHIFKPIVGIVALDSLVHVMASNLSQHNVTIEATLLIFGLLAGLFFYAWMLSRADNILMNHPGNLRTSLQVAKKSFLPLVGLMVIYTVLIIMLIVLSFAVQHVSKIPPGNIVSLLFSSAWLLVMFGFVYCSLGMPSIVLDGASTLKGVEQSIRLIHGHWWRTFGLIMVVIFPLTVVSAIIIVLIDGYNPWLAIICQLLTQIVTMPLIIALFLVLYHDLKTRHQKAGFKHLEEV